MVWCCLVCVCNWLVVRFSVRFVCVCWCCLEWYDECDFVGCVGLVVGGVGIGDFVVFGLYVVVDCGYVVWLCGLVGVGFLYVCWLFVCLG